MIQFEDNDPARPYCAGSLFPETIGKGGGADNHLKTIKTRSGHTIALDDADDTLSITIVDRKNNLIYIDSANNDITVTANRHVTINATETMTLNCKNMNVNVSENMVTKIGNDQQTTIGNNQQTTVAQDIAISATNVNEVYSEDSISNVGCKKTTTVGESDYFTTNGDMVIKSVGKALVQGAVDAKVSRG